MSRCCAVMDVAFQSQVLQVCRSLLEEYGTCKELDLVVEFEAIMLHPAIH